MNANAKAWVAALRSGDFKQGKGTLRNNDEYCCLGVACVLAEQAGVKNVWRRELILPPDVQEWLGLNSGGGVFINGNGDESLTRLNDEDSSFLQIADVIESEPEGLFVKESV